MVQVILAASIFIPLKDSTCWYIHVFVSNVGTNQIALLDLWTNQISQVIYTSYCCCDIFLYTFRNLVWRDEYVECVLLSLYIFLQLLVLFHAKLQHKSALKIARAIYFARVVPQQVTTSDYKLTGRITS